MPPDDGDPIASTLGFAKGAATGAKEGAVSMAESLWSMAKGAAKIVTDPAAADQAWTKAKNLADAAKQYGQESIADPSKPFVDARDMAMSLTNKFDAARMQAAATGKSAEFWGNATGRGAFEAGTFLVGAGEAGAVAKAGEAAEMAGDAARAGKVAEEVGQAGRAGAKATGVAENPALRAADKPLSPVEPCPLTKTVALDTYGLATKPSEAFFWSGETNGYGGEVVAEQIARENGGKTLEMLLEEKQIQMPIFDKTNPASVKAWEDASAEYSRGVSGEVRAVIGENLRENNIWENVELPRLKANPAVTKIITIDPVTRVEEVIFP